MTYEQRRNEAIKQNQAMLQSLGLLGLALFYQTNLLEFNCNTITAQKPQKQKQRKRKEFHQSTPTSPSQASSSLFEGGVRRSGRTRGLPPTERFLAEDQENIDREENFRAMSIKKRANKPANSFGSIPGIAIGKTWEMRMHCSEGLFIIEILKNKDLIMRPPVAGIHGGPDGCFSIALSGGYEDDLDWGESFTFTGEGGRDLSGTKTNPKNLRTADQSKDQTLTRGNLSLQKSFETKEPVRVIRGFKLRSKYAPERGYRYDGLYTVEGMVVATGLSGFKVFKFALKRVAGQPPLPVRDDFE